MLHFGKIEILIVVTPTFKLDTDKARETTQLNLNRLDLSKCILLTRFLLER